MFTAHSKRFKRNAPESIYSLFSSEPSLVPCPALQLSVCIQGAFVAISYVDVGCNALSSVYAMFDPAYSAHGLGIFTLLKEIELAAELGKRYLYLGYCYREPSFYDYKKQFSGTEYYNWRGHWLDL
jgi:arginine-tRNA-protein transferase